MDENFENEEIRKEDDNSQAGFEIEGSGSEPEIETNSETEGKKESPAPGVDKGLKTFLVISVVVLFLLLATLIGYFVYIFNGGNGKLDFGFGNSLGS